MIPIIAKKDNLGKSLYTIVENIFGIPSQVQMLLYCGKLIRPDVSLHHYNLRNNSCITVVVKGLNGGGESEKGQ